MLRACCCAPRVEFLVHVWRLKFKKRGEGELYKGPGPVLFLVSRCVCLCVFEDVCVGVIMYALCVLIGLRGRLQALHGTRAQCCSL